MVRFYCDRCNTEVDGPDDLIEIAIEGRERPSSGGWSWRSEMCRPCYDAFKEAVGALAGSDETKRKPIRRASS